jgi:DNA-binding beta-propeller fold protein YncE
VAVDPWARLWVTVPLAREVRAYSESGELQHTVPGASLQPPLETPVGIAVDPSGKSLVVTDIANRLVRILLPRPARIATPPTRETHARD